MKIGVVGAGPAGLYFAYLWKRSHPRDKVLVVEQNPADATWGFGVVFSDRALDFLRADDPATADLIAGRMETWRDMTINHRGDAVTLDGIGFSAIGRLELLLLLQQQARSVGADLQFDRSIQSVQELADCDLVVAADGLNSVVRRAFEGDFGTSVSYLDSKFVWFGTTKRFETLTQTFVESDTGCFNAHHYRYSPTMSTFIVECDRETWLRAGFASMPADEAKSRCEAIFASTLDGHPLVSNKSNWRNFPWLWNECWSFKNMVLVGDALHTAHYSIGSGTRLALEDVIALVKAMEAHPNDLGEALRVYESARRPIVEKLVTAAKASAGWYANFVERMKLPPLELAHSYLTRSGRIEPEKLNEISPRFAEKYRAHKDRSGKS